MVKKFTIPFASQGDANDIPDALQVDGKVSFTQGFGYDYERPYDDPQAKDIAREDMNGLFKAITSAVGELQTLGASEWSSAISYPKGAIVYYEKDLYISQVDGNQNEPPQNWISITSIANDSLKKAANLSDLTDKATARANLGLGSSATLNKTDTLGASSNLVATQKLVNDTKINLESSKQDKLTFVGDGPEVMKTGAGGFVNERLNNIPFNLDDDIIPCTQSGLVDDRQKYGYPNSLFFGFKAPDGDKNISGLHVPAIGNTIFITKKVPEDLGGFVKYDLYHNKNTTVDRSGFLRASGNANALTEADATPIGTIQAFIGENAPNDKYLLCRGQAFSATTYPDLAQLLPDLKIPDLRGVALRGLDANRGLDPGRALLSYQEDSFKSHTHELSHSALVTSENLEGGVHPYAPHLGVGRYSAPSGLTGDSETRMKNVAVNFIIKAR